MRTLEEILVKVGGAGRFQLVALVATTSPKVWMAWSMLEMSFANYVPEWCCVPDNLTKPADHYCHEDDVNSNFAKECSTNSSSSCNLRIYAAGVNTVVNEWDLVCERKWMVPLTTSIQMAGVLVGALISGQLMDLLGRKKTLFLNSALAGIFNVIVGFSTSWEMFATMRFLIGLSIGGYLAVAVLYFIEFLSPSKRKLTIIIPSWMIGTCLLALGSWRLQDWRWLHWVCGIGVVPTLLGYFFVPESMRWLAIRGRVDEAHKVVEQIARWNRREVPKNSLDIIKEIAEEEKRQDLKSQYKTYTYLDIYRGWYLFKTSIILQFLWLVLSMCAYGISFGAASLGFNVYLNIFLMGIISVPFLLTLHFIIDRVGRKKTGIVSFTLSSICGFGALAGLLLVPDSEKNKRDIIINVCNLLARGFQATAWSSVGMITNEIYPTVIRGLGSGAANTSARIGGILAPFALNIQDTPTTAFAVMGGVLLFSAFLVFFLDETSGKAMADTSSGLSTAVPGASTGLNHEMNVYAADYHKKSASLDLSGDTPLAEVEENNASRQDKNAQCLTTWQGKHVESALDNHSGNLNVAFSLQDQKSEPANGEMKSARTLEDLLVDVGGAGCFQLLALVAVSSPEVWTAWSMLEMSFANYVPQWCCLPDNLTTNPVDLFCRENDSNSTFAKECYVNTSSCSRRVYETDVKTVVNEWDLVCERKWMLPLTTSIQMAGVLVGALITGHMIDLFGRKKTLFVNAAFCGTFNIIAGFSTSWEMFTSLRFLIGLNIGGYISVAFLYFIEFLPPTKRKLIILVPSWTIGKCLLALGAWVLQDWRWVHWLCGIAMAPCLLGYFFIPESMRWLATKGRAEEAQKVLEWIARWNGRQVPEDSMEVIKAVAEEEKQQSVNEQYRKYTYLDIYRGWRLFKISIILQFLWPSLAMCSYGIAFGAASLGFNLYLTIFLMALVDIPLLIGLHFVIDRTGRRWATIGSLAIAGGCGFAALMGLMFIPDSKKTEKDAIITICNILARGFLGGAWTAVEVITSEIYPTVMRGLGAGAANTAARIGGILAPFALNIEDTPTIAFSVLGGILTLSALSVFFLEETGGKTMPDTTKDLARINYELNYQGDDIDFDEEKKPAKP